MTHDIVFLFNLILEIAQLHIFNGMVVKDYISWENLFGTISLKGRDIGIFNAFKNFLTHLKVSVFKLVSILAEDAHAMIGCINGVIALSISKWSHTYENRSFHYEINEDYTRSLLSDFHTEHSLTFSFSGYIINYDSLIRNM